MRVKTVMGLPRYLVLANDLLPTWSSVAEGNGEYDSSKLIVDGEVRGSRYDSSKLIVVGEVREYDSSKLIVGSGGERRVRLFKVNRR